MEMGELMRGVVKWFNDAKGFGFIEHETGRDVFVHYSVIESEGFKTLKDGEEVDYELREGDKGLHAARVIRVNPPAVAKAPEGTGAAKHPGESARGMASKVEVRYEDGPEGSVPPHENADEDQELEQKFRE
jgi:CspA family cold shock protein